MSAHGGGAPFPKVPLARSRPRQADVEGFGCPCTEWPHHVRVVISEVRGGEVRLVEDFGVSGHSAGQGDEVERCVLSRVQWNSIADIVRRDFNERLRALKLPPGAWKPGVTKVERMLGRELVMLACTVAAADQADVAAICANWATLRPEERWWFAGWLQRNPSPRVMQGAALLLSGGSASPVSLPTTRVRRAGKVRKPVLDQPETQGFLALAQTDSGRH